ncbi:hypothetical protein SAMD00019534_114060, partial [Acytostelium subglobosum LB1]|uniref:hypothetical protein n=1 Tax=Acytostelium subglobosum LB1 TaxID=1410327 RepID=UPI000645063B
MMEVDNNNEQQQQEEGQQWEQVNILPSTMSLTTFWYCMEKWTLDPQHIMKPIKRYHVQSRSTYNAANEQLTHMIYNNNVFESTPTSTTTTTTSTTTDQHEDLGDHSSVYSTDSAPMLKELDDDSVESEDYHDDSVRMISFRRHLIPRLTQKDNPIDDIVVHTKDNNSCTFKPVLPSPTTNVIEYLPFYYPKVIQFRFRYIPIDKSTAAAATATATAATTTTTTSTTTTTTKTAPPSGHGHHDHDHNMENADRGTPEKKQSFVDIGCGNGFLVNLLNMEGYPGIGIDLRSRKVWEKYSPEVRANLFERGIYPKDQAFPEYDWIIGNHSDELTPWVPYIASKSTNQRFFLLPCCFFNFMTKFQDNDPKLGQYTTYLNYIEKVSNQCGFQVIRDAMRIPSTKNIVFISSLRSPLISEERLNVQRQTLLDQSKFREFTLRPEQKKCTPKKRYRPGEYNPHLGKIMPPDPRLEQRKLLKATMIAAKNAANGIVPPSPTPTPSGDDANNNKDNKDSKDNNNAN